MIIVLSPAKTLDFESPLATPVHTQPEMLADSALLIEQLRGLDAPAVADLMSISPALATLNVTRFQQWDAAFSPANARQSVLAFAGDVYDGLAASSLKAAQLKWAQQHLRILSGLYGVLRPLDLMQAYRLEMGTRLNNSRGRDLYAFWGDRIARHLNAALECAPHPVLVNLASEEYFKSVDTRVLRAPIVQPVFQERRAAGYKVVSFSAKRARGMMARFAIEQRITDPEGLKAFDRDGYRFDEPASSASHWYFRRETP
jgi:cytoplasmic iron level regulating protein YaaA (DUF328/UPF0246 family)